MDTVEGGVVRENKHNVISQLTKDLNISTRFNHNQSFFLTVSESK